MILAHKQTAILCASLLLLTVSGAPSGVGRMVDNNEMAGACRWTTMKWLVHAGVKLCILCTSLGECCPNGCPRSYTFVHIIIVTV